MTRILILYKDNDQTAEEAARKISLTAKQEMDIVMVIGAGNKVNLIKNRYGGVASYEAEQINLTIPDRSINITPKS